MPNPALSFLDSVTWIMELRTVIGFREPKPCYGNENAF